MKANIIENLTFSYLNDLFADNCKVYIALWEVAFRFLSLFYFLFRVYRVEVWDGIVPFSLKMPFYILTFCIFKQPGLRYLRIDISANENSGVEICKCLINRVIYKC